MYNKLKLQIYTLVYVVGIPGNFANSDLYLYQLCLKFVCVLLSSVCADHFPEPPETMVSDVIDVECSYML